MQVYNMNYTRTIEGLSRKIYFHQLRNCNHRGHEYPTYTQEELCNWMKEPARYLIFCVWRDSDYDATLIPSVDRIDNTQSYTFENIELVTWAENMRRAQAGIRNKTLPNSGLLNGGHKAVVSYNLKGERVSEYISVSEAARCLNVPHQFISRACSTKFTYYNNLFWTYKEDEHDRKVLFTEEAYLNQLQATKAATGFAIEAHDSITNTVIEFSSKNSCAAYYGASPKTITKWLNNETTRTRPEGLVLTLKENN